MAKRNNVTGGLAALLQGFDQGAQQSYENKLKDPSRPISDNELQRMIMENYQKGLVNQMGYAGFSGGAPTPQNFVRQIMALNAIRNGASPSTNGYNVDTGAPNPAIPTAGIQAVPTAPAPAAPAAPTAVNRSGMLQSVADEMRRRGLFK